MALDPTATVTGTGGLLFAFWLLLKYKPWVRTDNGNGKHKRSGDLDPADWEKRISKIINEAIDDKFKNVAIQQEEEMVRLVKATVSEVFTGRNEQIRRIIREEVALLK